MGGRVGEGLEDRKIMFFPFSTGFFIVLIGVGMEHAQVVIRNESGQIVMGQLKAVNKKHIILVYRVSENNFHLETQQFRNIPEMKNRIDRSKFATLVRKMFTKLR